MSKGFDDLAAPFRYRVAQAEKKTAYEAYNLASVSLELAQIKERFAELYSQHDPVDKISKMKLGERAKLCAAAQYVITGRLPEEEE
jgi:hypothetical protein